MAAGTVVSCPKCEKKFKPKTDVQGKKIKCPFCERPFVVPLAKESKNDKDAKKPKDTRIKTADAKGKPEESKAKLAPTAADEKKKLEEELDATEDPYAVTTQELKARCPYCAKAMIGKNAIICLHCGYNTLTREVGKTKKIFGLTIDRHVLYLLPPVGAAIFAVCTVVALLMQATLVPGWVDGSWMSFLDSEAVRVWSTLPGLAMLWAGLMYCFKMFIEKPKPDDLKIE